MNAKSNNVSAAAARSGESSSAALTLEPGNVVDSDFDIVINYSGDPAYQAAFTLAVARWTQIITADIPDFSTTRFGLVDDLIINARIASIDGAGGTLGQAGPDILRDDSMLPAHGTMKFDSADVDEMVLNGTWTAVILHEMGHILGIGTLWDSLGLINASGNYIGEQALAEYRVLIGSTGVNSVPVEHNGGPGTAGAHWDEETFTNELMTGYAEATGPMPISRMTIASIEDMGYTVNYAAADFFDLPDLPEPPPDDFADDLDDSTAPFGQGVVNGFALGRLEVGGDHDWFRVELTAGTNYEVELRGSTGGGGLDDPYLRIFDSGGMLIAENDDINPGINVDSRLTFLATATDTYYVDAAAFGDDGTGTYRINVRADSITDDFADRLRDTTAPFGQVLVNASAAGELEVLGDRDWFEVELAAGTSYRVNLEGFEAGAGTLLDPYLRVHDGSGELLAENDDIVLGIEHDSQLTIAIATSGTYYIHAGAFDDEYAGTYRVSVSGLAPPTDDFADSLGDATAPFGEIAVGNTATGRLETTGDRDWFRVALTAGTTYVIDLLGNFSGAGTLDDPYLRLRDSSGVLLDQADDIAVGINRDALLTFTAAASGDFYIEAGGFADDYTGSYQVAVGTDDLIILGDNFDNELVGTAANETIRGFRGFDRLDGGGGDDTMDGGAGADTLIGRTGNDILDGGVNPFDLGDLLLGGPGDDTYHVDSGLDFVDEGAVFPEFGSGGNDTIVSTADFFWDLHSVGETLRIAENALDFGGDGTTAIHSKFSGEVIGNDATNVLFGRGGSDVYRPGGGIDFISFSTLGVPDAPGYVADGVNTLVMEVGNSYDIVFEFEVGKDQVDLTAFGLASTDDLFDRGFDDGIGNSYFALGDGFDYLYMVGLELSDLQAGDFIL